MTIIELEKELAYQLSRLKHELDVPNDMAEAWEEGEREGRLKVKLEIARNMKKGGVSIKLIAEDTGLSIEDIAEL
jgi:predicted transposase/invertase (TIGR01784 family)